MKNSCFQLHQGFAFDGVIERPLCYCFWKFMSQLQHNYTVGLMALFKINGLCKKSLVVSVLAWRL